jgi:hypothetical protein
MDVTDWPWEAPRRRISVTYSTEPPVTIQIYLTDQKSLLVPVYPLATFAELRDEVFRGHRELFEVVHPGKMKRDILFCTAQTQIADMTTIGSMMASQIFCVICARHLKCSVLLADSTTEKFKLSELAKVSDLRAMVEKRITHGNFNLACENDEYNEKNNVYLCSVLFQDGGKLFFVKSTLRQCTLRVSTAMNEESFEVLLPKQIRLSDLTDLAERRFSLSGRDLHVFHHDQRLSDPKQVLELDAQSGGNQLILRTGAEKVEQRIDLLEGGTAIQVKLPLSATVDDLLRHLNRDGYVHFEQHGIRVFSERTARLGSYPLNDEAVTLTVKERPRIPPLDRLNKDAPNTVTGCFILPPNDSTERWTFPEDATVNDAFSHALQKIRAESSKKYALALYDGDEVLQGAMLLKDVPERRDLIIVEVVDISVLPPDRPRSAAWKYDRLFANRTIAHLKRQVHGRRPDVEICSQDGEVLGDHLELGAVARGYTLPLKLIPTGSVRRVRIQMDHHRPKCFLVDEGANADGIRAILRSHYPGFSAESVLSDSFGALDPGSLVRELHGDITVTKRRNSGIFSSRQYSKKGPFQSSQFTPPAAPPEQPSASANLPGRPAAAGPPSMEPFAARPGGPGSVTPTPDSERVVAQVPQPRAATAVPPPFPPDRSLWAPSSTPAEHPYQPPRMYSSPPAVVIVPRQSAGYGVSGNGQRAGRPSGLVRASKPPDYDSLLRSLEDQSLAAHRNCARCFNFHGYNFDRALADLLSGPRA